MTITHPLKNVLYVTQYLDGTVMNATMIFARIISMTTRIKTIVQVIDLLILKNTTVSVLSIIQHWDFLKFRLVSWAKT